MPGARWNHSTGKWSAPFVMADTPGFPETNPVLFLDSKQRLFFLWPLIVAHKWETALMKYRISTDYQQADGPPRWEFQDNIVLIPKNIVAKTKEWIGKEAAGNPPDPLSQRKLDEGLSAMIWVSKPARSLPGVYFTKALVDPKQLPKIAADSLVFLADVTPTVVRDKVLAAGFSIKEWSWGGVGMNPQVNGTPLEEPQTDSSVRFMPPSPFAQMQNLGLGKFEK